MKMRGRWGRALMCALLTGAMVLSTTPTVALSNEDVPEWAIDDGADAQSGKLEAEAALPSKYDLRSDGLVTPVKSQSPWGACWAFAGIAAAETSMLSATGSTAAENPTDLSERHLAYFAMRPVTEVDDPVQAGEGICTLSDNRNAAFDAGGMPIYITTLFAQGVGPQAEAVFPYRGVDSEGNSRLNTQVLESDPEGATLDLLADQWHMTVDEAKENLKKRAEEADYTYDQGLGIYVEELKKLYEGSPAYYKFDDWTIPATDDNGYSNRTLTPFMTLKDGNVLPEYQTSKGPNWDSVNAIKQELVNGHGVSIAYTADQALPGENADRRYINRETWAQYTFESVGVSHAVCIVGYDDTYPASKFTHEVMTRETDENGNWVQDANGSYVLAKDENGNPFVDPKATTASTPLGNGAWIVKNSWGSETDPQVDDLGNVIGTGTYGVRDADGKATGYFYLSYYDKTITQPETMTFSADLLDEAGSFEVLQHDYMAAENGFYTTPTTTDVTSSANVFEAPQDLSLKAVSTRTSEENQRVTFAVYQLNDGATSPTDGTLLYRTSRNFEYAGFHRLDLDMPLTVRMGKRISVVSTASTLNSEGVRLYNASANQAFSQEVAKTYNENNIKVPLYGTAVVNKGESFLFSNGQWSDWSDYIAALPAPTEGPVPGVELPGSSYIDQFPIDNFSIKLYAEPVELPSATISGTGHVQTYGDQDAIETAKGILIGTTGLSKRLEAFSISMPELTDGGIRYRSHVQGTGWESEWAADGAASGTSGQSRRIEAAQVELTGNVAGEYDVFYRAHCQGYGWLGWAMNGEPAGTAGMSRRAEALEVQVLPKGQAPDDYDASTPAYIGWATGEAHVRGAGWLAARPAGTIGTTGQSRRLEAFNLKLSNQPFEGGIEYQAHLRGTGWESGWAADGATSGTTGQSRRVEAVRVRLAEGSELASHFSVWYRVHSQTYGWLGWAHDGEVAGTTGQSKRAEAVDVQLLPIGAVPLDYDASVAASVEG